MRTQEQCLNTAGAARARERRDDDDLHACREQRRAWRHEPAGCGRGTL